jgi:hypothetical protein
VILASCYEAVADAIDAGTIRSQAAAYASLRTSTQAKIRPGTWEPFLDLLSRKIQDQLGGSTDALRLGGIFREIADGLGERVSTPESEPACPDPAGLDCPVPK